MAQSYVDDGVSGILPLHEGPDGRLLLQEANKGKFATLLVYRLDKLVRSLLVIMPKEATVVRQIISNVAEGSTQKRSA